MCCRQKITLIADIVTVIDLFVTIRSYEDWFRMMHFINSATQFTALNFIERMWVWNFWYFFFVGTFLCVYLCTANVCMLFVWKTLYVPFRAVCFFEKKIVLFPEIFFNLVNDINFLVIEFEGCMNGKLQVWCKCTAPYIWLWRAREWGSSSAVSQ